MPEQVYCHVSSALPDPATGPPVQLVVTPLMVIVSPPLTASQLFELLNAVNATVIVGLKVVPPLLEDELLLEELLELLEDELLLE